MRGLARKFIHGVIGVLNFSTGEICEWAAPNCSVNEASAPPISMVNASANAVKVSAIVCSIVVGAMLLLPARAEVSDSATAHSKFVGVYLSHGDKMDPSMNVSLGPDGTATVVEDPGSGATTFFGHWVDSGTQVTVTFDAVEGKPAEPPMVFEPSPGGLQAVTWNHAAWGKVTPPVMKKGYKVKNKYWFTTIR
jgi:hypothetical protein